MGTDSNVEPRAVTVLLGTGPGRRRDSLQLLLAAIPKVAEVRVVESWEDLPGAVRRHSPAILVVDAAFDAQRIWALPALMQESAGRAPLLFLATTATERERARRMGAEATLLYGFSNGELRAAVGKLRKLS